MLYNTQSELAALAEAIAPNGISNLKEAADYAKTSGLTLYARVSALSDHLASWYDKGVAYMIQGSTVAFAVRAEIARLHSGLC